MDGQSRMSQVDEDTVTMEIVEVENWEMMSNRKHKDTQQTDSKRLAKG